MKFLVITRKTEDTDFKHFINKWVEANDLASAIKKVADWKEKNNFYAALVVEEPLEDQFIAFTSDESNNLLVI